jgi:hypothetical protein
MDTISDIERQQRADRQIVRADAELFVDLMKHKGWPRYMAIIETIAQNYHAAIMKPLDSSLEVVKVEFAKGVLSGLTLATAVPQMKIKEAQDMRRSVEEDSE